MYDTKVQQNETELLIISPSGLLSIKSIIIILQNTQLLYYLAFKPSQLTYLSASMVCHKKECALHVWVSLSTPESPFRTPLYNAGPGTQQMTLCFVCSSLQVMSGHKRGTGWLEKGEGTDSCPSPLLAVPLMLVVTVGSAFQLVLALPELSSSQILGGTQHQLDNTSWLEH